PGGTAPAGADRADEPVEHDGLDPQPAAGHLAPAAGLLWRGGLPVPALRPGLPLLCARQRVPGPDDRGLPARQPADGRLPRLLLPADADRAVPVRLPGAGLRAGPFAPAVPQ